MCDGWHQRVGGSRRRIGLPFSRESEKLLMFLIDVFFYRRVLLLQFSGKLQRCHINMEIKFMIVLKRDLHKCPGSSSAEDYRSSRLCYFSTEGLSRFCVLITGHIIKYKGELSLSAQF